MTDPTFRNINRLFGLLFKASKTAPTRNSFDKYYKPSIEINFFNALLDNKPFFYQLVKNKQETSEKLSEMPRNDSKTSGNLLEYSYNKKCYKIIDIDLSRQTNINILQQINFTEKLEEGDGE